MKEPFKLTWRHHLEIYCDGWNSGFFQTRSEIRESVRRKIREIEAREEERRVLERLRSMMEAGRISIPPDVAEEIFNHKNGKD